MRYLLTGVIYIFCLKAYGQVKVDTTIKLDLLKAPASPAFTILGIAPSDIERPTDMNSFTLGVQQATNNFTSLPKSYAIQVAPFLLSEKKFTIDQFDKNTNAFRQSFLLSFGFTNQGPKGKEDVDSLKTSKVGLGLKFSIIRPEWSNATRKTYNRLIFAQAQLLNDYRAFVLANDELLTLREELRTISAKENMTDKDRLRRSEIIGLINGLEEQMADSINKKVAASSPAFEAAKATAIEMKNERKGFFLDFSGGFALDFPDNRFNNSRAYRGGTWLTGGNEGGNSGLTSLFILRYLYNPETTFPSLGLLVSGKKFSNFDAGARWLYSAAKGKLAVSGEALYRSILGSNTDINPSWRLVLNAEYNVGINRKLTFSFGKDFDGAISKGGNLITALNLILGFGTERASPKL